MYGVKEGKQCWEVEGTLCSSHYVELEGTLCSSNYVESTVNTLGSKEAVCELCVYHKEVKR